MRAKFTGHRWAWLVIIATMPITAGLVRWEGRPWWCACGRFVPWSWQVISEHNSQHLIDPYSFTHVLHGLLFYGILTWVAPRMGRMWRAAICLVTEGAWEVFENSAFIVERYREQTLALGYYGDSVINALADVLLAAVGVAFAARLGFRWSLAVFIIFEALLLIWIRDSFLLNIVMLIYPLDAINQWQAGN